MNEVRQRTEFGQAFVSARGIYFRALPLSQPNPVCLHKGAAIRRLGT